MSKDRTVIHKVPVYSIEGILGLKDESSTTRNKLAETVIQKTGSAEQKESPSTASPEFTDKLSRNGKLVKLIGISYCYCYCYYYCYCILYCYSLLLYTVMHCTVLYYTILYNAVVCSVLGNTLFPILGQITFLKIPKIDSIQTGNCLPHIYNWLRNKFWCDQATLIL